MTIGSNTVTMQEGSRYFTRLEKVGIWIYEHPTIVKVAKIATLVMGLALWVPLPWIAPMLSKMTVVALAITGALLTLASGVAFLALDLIAPMRHEMSHHAFKPRQCEGGRLYYAGDVPILSLESDNPYIVGKAHGYLCGDAISRLSRRFGWVLYTLANQPRANKLPRTIAAIKQSIPPEYLLEMEGLIEGYAQWKKEQSWWQFPKELTLDDLILFHLMPDFIHFHKGSAPLPFTSLVKS